jgi:WD40 repeat protein
MASLNAFADDAWAVAFSPDGTRLVAGNQLNQLAIWDATTYGGQILERGSVEAIAVSPDSKRVVAGISNGRVELRGMDGAVVGGWRAHQYRVNVVALSRDGRRLITGSDDRTARLWDAASGAPGSELRGHDAGVTAAAFSPNGDLVATGSQDGTARVWDSTTGRPVTTIRLKYPVTSVTFSPDGGGLLVSMGWDPAKFLMEEAPVRLWNATTGALLHDFRTSAPCAEILGRKLQCPVLQASFSPDGRRLVASNGTVWDVGTEAVTAELPVANSTGTAIFSPDGSRIVTGSEVQGVVQIWDAVRYQPLLTLGGDHNIRSLTFSPDGARLLGTGRYGIRMWDTTTTHPPDRAGDH